MLENILGAVKEQALSQLGEFGLDQSQIEQTAEVTGESVLDGLKGEALGGNLDGVMDLLGGKGGDLASNPIVGKITEMLGSNLIEKVGLGGEQASGIAGGILPGILSSLMGKFSSSAEADAGFDLGAIMGMLGGENGNLMDAAKNIAGDKLGGMLGSFFGNK